MRNNFLKYLVFFLVLLIHGPASAGWEEMNSGTTGTLWSLWGSAGKDVYAAGENGVLIHYDGTSWSNINTGTTN